jgi:hypothetical protein
MKAIESPYRAVKDPNVRIWHVIGPDGEDIASIPGKDAEPHAKYLAEQFNLAFFRGKESKTD